jgi:hypothetical protein
LAPWTFYDHYGFTALTMMLSLDDDAVARWNVSFQRFSIGHHNLP